MNDMPSGGPALSGRCALEQMGETTHPIEISDGEAKAVRATIMASAMATDRAAESEVGDDKKTCSPRPALRYVPVGSLRRIGYPSYHDHPFHSYRPSGAAGLLVDDGRRAEPVLAGSQRTAGAARIVPFLIVCTLHRNP